MEIKVNDYVRTKQGNIFKIIGGNEDNYEIDIDYSILEQTEEFWYESNRYNDNGYWFDNENVVKSSPNIIDLIEVGDYVNGKEIEQIINNELYFEANDMASKISFEEKDIKSIVTKEQFEQMEYKID